MLGKKGWIFCSIAFCVQAVLLVTANLWYMYAVLHVHLPGEILLSEDVWNEALSGKVYICDEQKMTYLGFTTKIIREFIWGGLSIDLLCEWKYFFQQADPPEYGYPRYTESVSAIG